MNRSARGFTLLEVLIAMAVMSMIVSVIYASFSTAGRNVQEAEATRDAMDLARTLVAKLSADIANAYVEPGMNYPLVTTLFYGKKEEVSGQYQTRHDSLSLTTISNWREPGSKEMDLWEVGYFFKQKPDGSGYVLMRREKSVLSKDSPALEGGEEYEVTDRVKRLQFRYYDPQILNWSDEWDSRTRTAPKHLPWSVEITLVLDDGSAVVTETEVGRPDAR